MNTDPMILKNILANQRQQYIIRIKYHDQMGIHPKNTKLGKYSKVKVIHYINTLNKENYIIIVIDAASISQNSVFFIDKNLTAK